MRRWLPFLIAAFSISAAACNDPGDDDDSSQVTSSPTGDDDTLEGDDDTSAGDDDTSIGDDDTSSGDDDTSIGDDDTSSGDDDTSIGDDDTSIGDDDTSTGDDDTSVGDDDTSTGDDDTSIGDDDTSTGDDDTVSGDDDTSTGDDDTSIGDDDTSTGDDDTSVGDDDTSMGDDDTYTGDDDTSAGDDDTSTGDDDTSAGDDDTSIGDDDTSAGDDDTSIGDDDTSPATDLDQDGYPEPEDCNDSDPAIHPEAEEVCDGQDNDCNGAIDDLDEIFIYYIDMDGDGYGGIETIEGSCQPEGYVALDGDCDDGDTTINPDAEEICDGKDNNCDGAIDDSGEMSTYYVDSDEDGYGGDESIETPCGQPDGYVEVDGDCDDADPASYPGAPELCDGRDNDCDGIVDEDPTGDATWYADQDGDGHGDSSIEVSACEQPDGYVRSGDDCNDQAADVYPGADEYCDGIDHDCDDEVLEADSVDASTYYADTDQDGFGDENSESVACSAPEGYVEVGGDCDDASAEINPAADEYCDEVDNDCDGQIDEPDALDVSVFYFDYDLDGYGSSIETAETCTPPQGYVDSDTDCADDDETIYPGADEYCDEIDSDCDGSTDDADALDSSTFFADEDGDGYGDAANSTESCSIPDGYADTSDDCDDSSESIYPDAEEFCDDVDHDCDGQTDDAWPENMSTFYFDADEDGYGTINETLEACVPPDGYSEDNTDCDDSDATISPEGLEICDSSDNNCDGQVDESSTWWNADWPYRLPLTLTTPDFEIAGAPVAVDVDFRAALDQLGDDSDFEADSIRVVLQDCAYGQPVLPSQFSDGWTKLFDKELSEDELGDEKGMLTFLYDQDGDYSSLESPGSAAEIEVAIYFGSGLPAASYDTGLESSESSISTGLSVASFASDAGGLLSTLEYSGSPSLMSQTTSCCGNSIYSDSWGIDPQDGAGTLTLLEQGPVFAALEATGARSDGSSAYEYSYIYWMFAGRPELWSKVLQVTTEDSVLSHTSDYTNGIRPWESQQANISSTASFFTSSASDYADISNGEWGISWAYHQPPKYIVGISNYDPYLIVQGNDFEPSGSGTPGYVPADTAYMDNIVQVVLPHSGDFDGTTEDTLLALIQGSSVELASPESR